MSNMGKMKNMMETTTITLSKATVERLKKLGHKGETYEDVVQRLLEIAQKEES